MKKTLILTTLFLVLGSSFLWGQKKDFIEEYTYTAGDRDSKDICYDIAKTRLRSILLDKVGVYVRSESVLKTTEANGKYNQNFVENIATTSAGITEFNVIDQKWDGVKYWMKAVITIDTTSLRQLVLNREKLNDLEVLKEEVKFIRAELDVVKGSKNISTPVKHVSEGNQLYTKQIISAGKDDAFNSLRVSKQNNLLFLTTTKGRMIVLNERDSIIKIVKFKTAGKIYLDYKGEMGAYCGQDHIIYLFNQKTLEFTDTIRMGTKGFDAYSVWFTKTGRIFISSKNNIYRYGLDLKINIVAPSFTILDYSEFTDQFLLGSWDNSMTIDRKIKKLFTCDATNIDVKKQVLILNSFEVYSYFMDNGGLILSYDGRGNYYKFNVYSWQKSILVQDTITNDKKRIFGLSKIDENIVMVVKHYPFDLTPENIHKYGVTIEDNPTEFLFKKVKGEELVRSIVLLKSVSGTNIVVGNNKTIYYVSTGLNNKLIAIK